MRGRRRPPRPPETACSCGIHGFRDRAQVTEQFAAAESLVAVVALEGATVEGDRGWRSQAAQVVAVWIADDARAIHRGLPGWFVDGALIQAATFLVTVAIKTAVLSCLLQMDLADPAEPQGVLQSWLTATRNLLTYLVLKPGAPKRPSAVILHALRELAEPIAPDATRRG